MLARVLTKHTIKPQHPISLKPETTTWSPTAQTARRKSRISSSAAVSFWQYPCWLEPVHADAGTNRLGKTMNIVMFGVQGMKQRYRGLRPTFIRAQCNRGCISVQRGPHSWAWMLSTFYYIDAVAAGNHLSNSSPSPRPAVRLITFCLGGRSTLNPKPFFTAEPETLNP